LINVGCSEVVLYGPEEAKIQVRVSLVDCEHYQFVFNCKSKLHEETLENTPNLDIPEMEQTVFGVGLLLPETVDGPCGCA
jgi:hypothetical protein